MSVSVKKSISIRFLSIRKQSEKLCKPLAVEDYVVQPVVDVSPPKWHLGHTTWFFERFVLIPNVKNYKEFDKEFNYLFNSYYETVGERVQRPLRGMITRPSVEEIYKYRKYVSEHMENFLDNDNLTNETLEVVELGLQHEQQHQELLLYDIKYILGNNPLFPQYLPTVKLNDIESVQKAKLLTVDEGVYSIGHKGNGFCFDNEKERHKVYIAPFQIMNRLTTNGEYLEFMEEGGYKQFKYWLSEGWEWVKTNKIEAPFYWQKIDNEWYSFELRGGLRKIDVNAPVAHISLFEADAFARWKNKRLLTEFEWEVAAQSGILNDIEKANFAEKDTYETTIPGNSTQLLGDLWEWTNSAYLPYPHFTTAEGAIGEYNGKFMINQMVLRGGSYATPKDHIRITYRNFFHPHLRWHFAGIRLGESI